MFIELRCWLKDSRDTTRGIQIPSLQCERCALSSDESQARKCLRCGNAKSDLFLLSQICMSRATKWQDGAVRITLLARRKTEVKTETTRLQKKKKRSLQKLDWLSSATDHLTISHETQDTPRHLPRFACPTCKARLVSTLQISSKLFKRHPSFRDFLQANF